MSCATVRVAKIPRSPWLLAGGGRHDKNEKYTTKRLYCATIKWPDYPDQRPALSGGVGRTKYGRTTSNQVQKLRKCVLRRNRVARLPTPDLALSGGAGRTKQEGTPQTPTQKVRKRRKQTDKKKTDPPNPEKRNTIKRHGDAKISYPRLRLEIHPRYVRPVNQPPTQTTL